MGDEYSFQEMSDAKPDPSILLLAVGGELQKEEDSESSKPESSLSLKDVIKEGKVKAFKPGKKVEPNRFSNLEVQKENNY